MFVTHLLHPQRWHRRYYTLAEGILRCHKSERHCNAALKPRWEVDLSGPSQVEHIGIATVKRKNCFEVR